VISILGEVLSENGIVGGIGALLAMSLETLATSLLEQFIFKTGFCTLLVADARGWNTRSAVCARRRPRN
jgi:hypothetical protein